MKQQKTGAKIVTFLPMKTTFWIDREGRLMKSSLES